MNYQSKHIKGVPYFATSNNVNQVINMLDQLIFDLQAELTALSNSSLYIGSNVALFPTSGITINKLGIDTSTRKLYSFNGVTWNQVTISAPINTVAPVISGTLVVGNVLTCSTGTWTSDTGIIPPYTYQWYRGATLLVGETNNTYTLVQADAGQNIKCVVTACDSDGCTNADSNVVYIIDAEAQAHFDRVVADGGTIPLGLTALNEFVVSVKNNYSVASVNTAMWALKPHWGISGIKTASGTGATAGGRATSVLYDICGVNGDFIQTTASAQPLALVHSGSNYAWLSGVASNYFSTPNAVANQITGDIDIIVNLTHLNWNPASAEIMIGKRDSGSSNIAYSFFISNGSTLSFRISSDGNSNLNESGNSTVAVPFAANTNGWVRLTRVASTGVVTFFTSTNPSNTNPSSVAWTQLGATVSTNIYNIFNAAVPLTIGTYNTPTAGVMLNAIVFRATISNSIGGSPVVDFNPSSYNRATSQTSWVSATGETWTLNTASTNNALKAEIVDQTMIMGNGTSYGMRAPNLNINDTAITSYTVFRKFVNTAGLQAIREISDDYVTGPGALFNINTGTNQEGHGIRANVGRNASVFTSTGLGLKLATMVNNIANANESLPYLINNVSQSFISQTFSNNNTTAMNATGLNFLARNNAASAWANVIAIGDIVVKGEDDNTKRTAMYNLLKTLSKI